MKKNIKPPFLTTSFSENGKQVKSRFENIIALNRRTGAVIVALLAAAAVAAGAMLAFGGKSEPKPEAEITLAERLYSVKNPYVGNASKNGALTSALGISSELGGFANELQTSREPYGRRLVFEKDFDEAEAELMRSYACVLLALTENLGYVEWNNGSLTEEEASEIVGSDIKAFADSPETVAELLTILGIEENVRDKDYRELVNADADEFAENALVINNGTAEKLNVLNEFLNITVMRQPAKLDFIVYTEEGDPILNRLRYDSDGYLCSEYDGHDRFHGDETYFKSEKFKYLKAEKSKGGGLYFYLANDKELSAEEIFNYLLSSTITENPPEYKLLFWIDNKEANSYENAIY